MMSYLYALIIYPIEMFIETVFTIAMEMIPSAGYAIVFVSIAVQLLVLPIYKRADKLQEEERLRQKEMSTMIRHIKSAFSGDERIMMLTTYYREQHYHQYYQISAVLPLLLQIPFFIAAYNFLSECSALEGAAFYFLKDMGRPDGMFSIGGFTVNVMPIAMTLINIISGMIYTRGLGLKDKIQLYLTAGVFLVLLYDSPSGLVFYWTLNNVFSLLKNIFMKLIKHPRPIISVASILFVCAYCYKCYTYGDWTDGSGRIVMIVIFVAGFIPMISLLLDKRAHHGSDPAVKGVNADDRTVFRISGVVLAITTGILIPVVTMASSPAEFVIRGHYVNPLWQALYSFAVAAGLFVLWGNIVYAFYSDRAKKILCVVLFLGSACALVNSQFFREHLNNMSLHMQYNRLMEITPEQKWINLAVLFGVCLVCLLLYRFSRKAVILVAVSLAAVVTVMSGYNIYKIQRTLASTPHLKDDGFYTDSEAHFTLDKSGKNVIVFMLDRAMGPYVPYIFNEKPELADVFSGFTYYPNTITYGPHTITGAPALMGGYDYTTYKVKDMTGDEYKDYRRSSINVMPTLFAENGYKCTVLDSPIELGGQSIEDYYHEIDPDIEAYYACGVLKSPEAAAEDYAYFEHMARKNYIRHSFFLTSPLFLRMWIYDDGAYHMQERADDRLILRGNTEELDQLSALTTVTDTGDNTYTFILNETPHCINADLQMPDYTMEDHVDNSPYLDEWRNTLGDTPGDRKINMYTDWAIQSYEMNITSYLRIAEWIKYLKENGLYDNTRIILVSDHGFYYFAFDDLMFDDGYVSSNIERLAPLLMVKDFGDGKFTTSEEFMTNGDVPTLAMEGLISDPVNPNTGNPINSEAKNEPVQYVFDDENWLSVHDDMRDMSNWKVEDIEYTNEDIVVND